MKFDIMNEEKQQEMLQKLNESEDKSKAIIEVIDEINQFSHADIIQKVTAEADKAKSDSLYRESLGLRNLSKSENSFYEKLKDINQKITADQTDILPTSIIDYTLENVKTQSRIAELITFTPADVKKWIVAEKTGKGFWANISAKFEQEIDATFKTLNIEVGKLYAMIIVPKAIRELSNGFVDRYLIAVLQEALYDGIATGFLTGSGVDMPTGIFNLVDAKIESGEAKPKTVLTTVKGFSPSNLKEVKKTLSNGGLRVVSDLKLICNPADNYEFVEPALFGQNIDGSYSQKSNTHIDVIEDANCPKGKAVFTLPNLYTMGFSGFNIQEYKETLAKDDANLLIAKCYGNGRAVDNSTAVVFDVTKLEEYVTNVKVLNAQTTPTK